MHNRCCRGSSVAPRLSQNAAVDIESFIPDLFWIFDMFDDTAFFSEINAMEKMTKMLFLRGKWSRSECGPRIDLYVPSCERVDVFLIALDPGLMTLFFVSR